MSPAILAIAVLLASVVSHECAAAQSWVYVPPTNDSRLDFVFSSADKDNSDLYSVQRVDSDHITCNGYYTAYESTQPLPAQQQIAFPYGQPARFGVAQFANNTDSVPVAGVVFIYFSIRSLTGGKFGPGPVVFPDRVEFVLSPRLGSNVTISKPDVGLAPDCVFGQRPSAGQSVVRIVCGGSNS